MERRRRFLVSALFDRKPAKLVCLSHLKWIIDTLPQGQKLFWDADSM